MRLMLFDLALLPGSAGWSGRRRKVPRSDERRARVSVPGGSQFFITHSPQPHLEARYTAFGRVIKGMEVVDQIEQLDVIRRVLIWDGENLK